MTSCTGPKLDSDIKYVEGEKQRVKMLSQTPRYVRISNRIYPTKFISQTPRIPQRDNNAPQNRDMFWFSIEYLNIHGARSSICMHTWYFLLNIKI